MAQDTEIPEDVQNAPAGPEGNGFVAFGVVAQSIVGSDGKIYERKDGKISITPEDDDGE